MSGIRTSFSAATAPLGGVATLTYVVHNTDGFPLTNVSFTDVFPVDMVVAPDDALSNPGGISGITAPAGGNEVAMTGVNMATGEIITFSVDVKATIPGVYTEATSLLSTNELGSIPFSNGIAAIAYLRNSISSLWALFQFDAKTRQEEEA